MKVNKQTIIVSGELVQLGEPQGAVDARDSGMLAAVGNWWGWPGRGMGSGNSCREWWEGTGLFPVSPVTVMARPAGPPHHQEGPLAKIRPAGVHT